MYWITKVNRLSLVGAAALTALLTLFAGQRRSASAPALTRDKIFNRLDDGVIVLDTENRIADINPAARALTADPDGDVIGKPAASVLPFAIESDATGETRREATIGEGERQRFFDLRILPLCDEQGKVTTRLITLHEITQHKRAETELRASERYLSFLNEINQAATGTLDLEAVLPVMADKLKALLNADRCYLVLWEAEGVQAVSYVAPDNLRDQPAAEKPKLDEQAITESALKAGAAIFIANPENAPPVDAPADTAHTERALLALPLITGEQKLGAALLLFDRAYAFTSEEQLRAEQIAAQAASVLAKAKQFDEARRRARELTALHNTSLAITASQDLPTLLRTIIERATQLLDTPYGSVYLCDEERQEVRCVLTLNTREDYTGAVLKYGEGVAGTVAQTGKPLVIANYRAWAERMAVFEYDEPFGAVLSAPMIWQGHITGIISVLHNADQRRFTQADMELLSLLADQAGVAIENARLFREVQRLAITDDLTGIYNRRHLFTLGEHEFQRARRFERFLSAIMLDIDHFKRVNDTYGHAIGDQVLRIIAQRCSEHIRDVDVIGRYGGEEMGIILPEANARTARQIAERLRVRVSELPIPTSRGMLNLTISLGVAPLVSDVLTLDVLFDRADAALYVAKQTGRNRVAVYGESVRR